MRKREESRGGGGGGGEEGGGYVIFPVEDDPRLSDSCKNSRGACEKSLMSPLHPGPGSTVSVFLLAGNGDMLPGFYCCVKSLVTFGAP